MTEAEKPKARVMIGVPMERTVPEPAFWSFIALAQQGYAFVSRPYDRIDVTRNRLAQHLVDSREFTHLLMLDLDHQHPHDIVKRLARWWLKDPKKLVIAGLNFRRNEPYDPLVWFRGPDGQMYHATDWPDGLLKCDVVGTGAMLIHRSVFETLPAPWFMNDYSQVQAYDSWPGEDVGFCNLCGKAGIAIYCDTTCTSPHLSHTSVDQKTYRAYIAGYPEMAESELDWIREKCPWLWDAPGRILYVGANTKRAYLTTELKEAGNHLDLLEIWAENIAHYAQSGVFETMIHGDVRTVEGLGHYDSAVWLHGPEHVTKEDIGAALHTLEACADNVVLLTPYGYMEQGTFRGNPNEQHVSEWVAEDFEKLGYQTSTRGRRNEGHACVLAWKRKE